MRRSALVLVGAAVVLLGGCFLFDSGILYEEFWSDPNTTSWVIGDSDAATKSTEGGRYHVRVKKAATMIYTNIDEGPFGDVQIDLDVKHEEGANDLSAEAMVFRYSDIDNLYMFQVSPAGTFRVTKWVADVWSVLVAWTASDVIKKGVAENHLTVLAEGTSLTFLINGTQVAEVSDSSHSTGRVGVSVQAYNADVDVEGSFDNLVVRELE